MKKKMCIVFVVLICLLPAMLIFSKSNKTVYSPKIHPVNEIELEEGNRYLILYHTEENKYYLGKVLPYGLDVKMYDLGNQPCNFKMYNNEILISNKQEVIYPQTNQTNYPDEVFDITELGLLKYYIYGDMQILHRYQQVNCILSPKYYEHFAPIDLIQY